MAYFPVLIDFKDAPCLVAGGGRIALHKVKLLLEQGADITVIAPDICEEIKALPVKTELRKVKAEDVSAKMLVVDASGSAEAESILSKACKDLAVPYNCAGFGDACSAIFPAVFKKGRTIVAVSSQGASPPASVWLRDELSKHVPSNMDDILDRMAEVRIISKETFSDQLVRRDYLKRCLGRMLESGTILTEDEELAIRDSVRKQEE